MQEQHIKDEDYFISIEKLNIATISNANVRSFCGINHYLDCLYVARSDARKKDANNWCNYFNQLGKSFDKGNLLEQLEASALNDIENGKIGDILDQKLIAISSLNLLSTDKVKFAYQIIGILSSLVYIIRNLPRKANELCPKLIDLLKQVYEQYSSTKSAEPDDLEDEKKYIKALKEAKILDLQLAKKIIDINSIQIIKDNFKDLSQIYQTQYTKYLLVDIPRDKQDVLYKSLYEVFCDIYLEFSILSIWRIAKMCSPIIQLCEQKYLFDPNYMS